MRQEEAKDLIERQVAVTRQDVTIAKAFILANFNTSPDKMTRRFLEQMKAHPPQKVILHPSVEPEPQIAQVAASLRWRLALAEAIWKLIGAGVLLPTAAEVTTIEAMQEWTTVVAAGGGTSSGWRFERHNIALPRAVRLAPTHETATPQPLSDADLFLESLDIPGIDPDVEEALRQAVHCFRFELFLPSLAMLALASEGAWVQLGESLIGAAAKDDRITAEARARLEDELANPYTSVLRKMELVAGLYQRRDVFKDVEERSGYGHRHLNQVLNWSNVIRDSRNAIHYAAEPATENTYEKVAALLLGVHVNLRILSAIRAAAEEVPTQAG